MLTYYIGVLWALKKWVILLLLLSALVVLRAYYVSRSNKYSLTRKTFSFLPFVILITLVLAAPLLILGFIFVMLVLGFDGVSSGLIITLVIVGLIILLIMLGVSFFLASSTSFLSGGFKRDMEDEYLQNSDKPKRFTASKITKDDIGDLFSLAEDLNTDGETLKKVYDCCSDKIENNPFSPYWSVIYRIANNRSTPLEILEKLAVIDNNPAVIKALKNNPAAVNADIVNLNND